GELPSHLGLRALPVAPRPVCRGPSRALRPSRPIAGRGRIPGAAATVAAAGRGRTGGVALSRREQGVLRPGLHLRRWLAGEGGRRARSHLAHRPQPDRRRAALRRARAHPRLPRKAPAGRRGGEPGGAGGVDSAVAPVPEGKVPPVFQLLIALYVAILGLIVGSYL